MDSFIAPDNQSGRVLLLGGVSGTGKTSLAKAIAKNRGVTWVQIDDIRLALQASRVQLPTTEATNALYFFERTPSTWSLSATTLRDAHIATSHAMTDAISIVVGNHIEQNDSAVIEGDAIIPSLLDHPSLREYFQTGLLSFVFLEPKSERELISNHLARGRGVDDKTESELRRMVESNWLFSEWISRQARARSLPVFESHPFESLLARVISDVNL